MRRGAFVGALGTAAGGTFAAAAAASRAAPAAVLKPRRLRKGDAVGLVAPAGPLRHAEDLEHARRLADELGVRLVLGAHVRDRYGYLAGNDAARADDFNRFARDPAIRGIFALRGGYGCMRILGAIDYRALAADPKIVLGFSDLTALLNAITARTGLVTFHGPVAGHTVFPESLDGIRRALMSPEPLGVLRVPSHGLLAHGTGRGRLAGGNLSIVAALCGTPFAVSCADAILLLEDVKEAPYRVDRMLTQLELAGALGAVAGIALGHFVDCVPKTDDDKPSLTIDETLRDRLGALKKPMITHVGIGHIDQQWTLPIGLHARFDGDAGTLLLDESSVV